MGIGCSRKKDKFLNRGWHYVTTQNNTLYNGGVAFDKGKEEIVQKYQDNFWELMPIERLIVSEDVRIPGEVLSQNFDKAEEKAAKAIQKHSMLIDDRERNAKIDEAFLLLGKSRYYEQRFIPALEAFNYILYKYPTSNTINHAKVWREKTNIRLDNNELAIENLERLLRHEKKYIKPQDYADATAMLAQAYINLNKKDTAVAYIKIAAENTKNNEEKGRYLYIKGQLYNQLGFKDSANYAFDEVIDLNRKTPRQYMLNAYMAKARNFDYETGDKLAFLELLNDLEENRENRPFLDKIYYQKAEYFRHLDSIDLAVHYYKQSLKTKTSDQHLKSLDYNILGNIKFDERAYAVAGKYYDSTLKLLNPNAKRFRRLKKKRDNLDDVILYEGIAQVNDSILNAIAMSPEERIAYYSEYTAQIKAEAIAKAEAEEIAKIKENLPIEKRFQQPTGPVASGAEKGKFYFYNPTTVAIGKTSFRRTFGNRKLQDNWKISSLITSPGTEDEVAEKEEEYSIDTDPQYDPQTYIALLPTDAKVIDSLKTERNFAYYQLGIIYKEKFQEYDLASEKLEEVLVSNPEERLIIPSKYNLYKIYETTGNKNKAEEKKNDIIQNHVDSRYADILKNPNKQLEADKDSPEYLYNTLFNRFRNQEYAKVITDSDTLITRFAGENFVSKFALLKAQAIGRYRGYNEYTEALNYVALTYPQSPEGKKAERMIKEVLPGLKGNTFVIGQDEKKNNKLIYEFSTQEMEKAQEYYNVISDIIKELKYEEMKVSLDVYTKDKIFVVIHTKRTKLGAEGLAELLSLGRVEDTKGVDLTRWNRRKKYYKKITRSYFIVASPNYRIIQIHKNWENYLAQNTEIKPN